VDAGFWRGSPRYVGRVRSEKGDDPVGDFLRALGDGIAPAAGRIVVGKDGALGAWQPHSGTSGGFGGWPARARDHQNAVGDIGKGRRIETARHAQHDAGEALGMLPHHVRDVPRDRGPEVSSAETQVIQQRDQPIGRG
jgi:hypothetical protein